MKNKIRYKYTSEVVSAIPKWGWLRFLLASPKWAIISKLPGLADKIFEVFQNERIIDYPFAHANIGLDGKGKILDLGCCGSVFPVELASLGHVVFGLDTQDYSISHPNFSFIKADISNLPFRDESFDVVTAISTIEHIGLKRYKNILSEEGDKKAVKEVTRILKRGGRLIMSVPFGKASIVYYKGIALHRCYDLASLKSVLDGLQILKMQCFVRVGTNWVPTKVEEAEKMEELEVWHGYHLRISSDCLIVAQKQAI